MAKVRLNLSKLSVEEKGVQGATIKNAMTGNPDFATPVPSLADFTLLYNALEQKNLAYMALVEQAKLALNERDAAEAAYDAGVTQLGSYAEGITGGDEAKLRGGGFEVRKDPEPIGPLGEVMGLALKVGLHDGELKARWKPLRGAKSYDIQVSPDPFGANTWRSVEPSSKCYCTLTGLTSGTKMWVRVRGIGKGPAGNWCDPAARFVA